MEKITEINIAKTERIKIFLFFKSNCEKPSAEEIDRNGKIGNKSLISLWTSV